MMISSKGKQLKRAWGFGLRGLWITSPWNMVNSSHCNGDPDRDHDFDNLPLHPEGSSGNPQPHA